MEGDRLGQGVNREIDLSAVTLPTVGGIPLYRGGLEADLEVVSRRHLAQEITGGLSWPSKMPCPAWGIPATRCRTGSVLARQEGTTCSECYALRGRYTFNSVQAKLEERYQGLFHPLWVPAMIFLIRRHADTHFRWFDSGDLLCGAPHNEVGHTRPAGRKPPAKHLRRRPAHPRHQALAPDPGVRGRAGLPGESRET